MLVPSSMNEHETEPWQFLTSYLINDTVAIDAGSLGFFRDPHEQARVRHILISHSHIDHIASLPIFLENAYDGGADPVTVHGSETVLHSLRTDIFNDRVWPDFIHLPNPQAPFVKLQALVPGQCVELEGLRITPVPVNHAVPTLGFIVEDPAAALVISSDTGPTEELWRFANAVPNLRAVFLEVTFPNALAPLAEESKHLTPATFGQELRKLHPAVPIIAVHIKARYYAQVVQELHALGLPDVRVARGGVTYSF